MHQEQLLAGQVIVHTAHQEKTLGKIICRDKPICLIITVTNLEIEQLHSQR